ncbi:MAG: hypothetical protein R2912_01360 [Eubacteriales bacterium]
MEKNGITAVHPTRYSSDPKKVEVVVTATVDYTFARILGLNCRKYARAVAEDRHERGFTDSPATSLVCLVYIPAA